MKGQKQAKYKAESAGQSVFYFKWAVDTAGYSVVRHEVPSGIHREAARALLSGARIVRRGGKMKPVKPVGALHRLFALAVADEASALAFVHKYGFLGSLVSGPEAAEESVESILSCWNCRTASRRKH